MPVIREAQTGARRAGVLVALIIGVGLALPQSAEAAKPFAFFAKQIDRRGARKRLQKHIRRCRKANRTVTECAIRRSRIPRFFSKASVAFGKSNKLFSISFHTRAGDSKSIPKAMSWLGVDDASMGRPKEVFGRLISQGTTQDGLQVTMSSSPEGVLYYVSGGD